MEMQFDHIPFIKDLNVGIFNYKNFFSTYGEHITAGYNIILAINYYLFNISGYFDNYFFIFLNFINFFLLIRYFKNFEQNFYKDKIFILLVALTCFSLTNNPMFGMSLSAKFGITLTLLAIYLLKSYFVYSIISKLFLSFIFFLISIGLFLGGYAIGVLSFLFLSFAINVEKDKNKKKLIFLSLFIISLIVYLSIFLISNNTVLVNHVKGDFSFNSLNFINFLSLMIGSSFLGKSFFESTSLLWPYYSIAVLFIFWCLPLIRKFIFNKDKPDIMIFFMIVYPISTIFFATLFRHNIGGGDALGQWYFQHIHFLPLISYLSINYYFDNNFFKFANLNFKKLSLTLLILYLLTANIFDIKKSPFVANWKMQFYNQVPSLIFDHNSIDVSTIFNSMLYDAEVANKSLLFFYHNDLWIFKNKNPLVFKNIIHNGKFQVQIICPIESKFLSLTKDNISDFYLTDGFEYRNNDKKYTFIPNEFKKNYYEFLFEKNLPEDIGSRFECL